MGGREVAERIQELRPDIKVLYMTGYTDDDVLHERLAGHRALCLSKPFTAEKLTVAVRTALGG
jgi:CheY-like chemotaxis protein